MEREFTPREIIVNHLRYLADKAERTGQFTPDMSGAERGKFDNDVAVYVAHLRAEIVAKEGK